jgi:hypothetical protein
MTILDELFGIGGWQSSYEKIDSVLYCKIGVWGGYIPREIGKVAEHWIWKQSNGIESKGTGPTDGNNVKGEASDAFKRAGFMWGIGRELYEWDNLRIDYDKEKDKWAKFYIKEIAYTDKGKPKDLIIVKVANYTETIVYTMKNGKYIKNGSKVVKKENASNHTGNKGNDNTEQPEAPKGNIEPEVDVLNIIHKKNSKMWGEIVTKIKEVAFDNEQESVQVNEILKKEPFDYFVNELKLKTNKGKLVGVEFTKTNIRPLVSSNTVIPINEEFYAKFTKYLVDKVFLPF